LVEVQEAERRALANELHDLVGQKLTALSINLNVVNGGGRRVDDRIYRGAGNADHRDVARRRVVKVV
jgi:signal transduction histidine kinase